MKRVPLPFFILYRQGSKLEYRFPCPVCQKPNAISLAVAPEELICLYCAATLDASKASVELLKEPKAAE